MKDFLIKEIQPDSYFSKNTYLDKGFILTAPETPYTLELVKLIEKWNYKSIYSEGEAGRNYSGKVALEDPSASAGLSQQTDSDKLEKGRRNIQLFYKFYGHFIC
ncbi:MAG: hypothetical protein FWC17_03135 [Treponema sp.]|nr:hypothetical protein [Treponema sp.]